RWLEVLCAAAARAEPATSAGLCHGAAGLAHIYNRVHQATALDWAREAALARFAELEAALADPAVLADRDAVAARGEEHRGLQEELAWLMREWERAAESAGV
ncbi:MAG TPA: hypothetical protein VFG74_10785, partial [Miltoncostaeaceae bacterium]|nr:hypothetical protein [Miltoncostaeaceae bacterium]